MQAIPKETRVNLFTNTTCGVPNYDSWQILRAPLGSDMPWPGFFFGQTPASICKFFPQKCIPIPNQCKRFNFFWFLGYWAADQMMVQKALSAKSLSHAQGATLLTGWIKVLPLFLIVVPGMISRVLYPDEVGCVDPELCLQICQVGAKSFFPEMSRLPPAFL